MTSNSASHPSVACPDQNTCFGRRQRRGDRYADEGVCRPWGKGEDLDDPADVWDVCGLCAG